MKEKVLYIGGFDLPDRNAAAQRAFGISYSLRDLGYEVNLIGLSQSLSDVNKEYIYNGIKYINLPYPKSLSSWLLFLLGFNHIISLIKNNKPNKIILYNYPSFAMWRILKYCKKNNIKVFADITEWYEGGGSFFKGLIKALDVKLRMNYLHFKLDGLIVISKFLNEYYSQKIKTSLVPPTFDINDIKLQAISQRETRIESNIKLVYSGSPGAGNKDRLDVIVNIVKKLKNIDFTIIGISKEQYIKVFGSMDEVSNVHFAGRLTHTQAINIIKSSDFSIFYRGDTLTNRAGFPTKFAESITLGIPVITNSSSNVADYINEYNIGFLVEGFDVKEFETILIKVSTLSSEKISDIKNNCLSMQPFDYRKYNAEISKIF